MENTQRYKLAMYTIFCGFVIIIIFSVFAFSAGSLLKPQDVLNSVLPMIATWIGAIIAFYFGRENFEAAQQQIKKFLDKDTLDDIPVKNIMIHFMTMVIQKTDRSKKLSDYHSFLVLVNKTRLPLSNDTGNIEFIIHKSVIDNALVSHSDWTLEEFLDSMEHKGKYGPNQPKGFIVVNPNEKLEAAMLKKSKLEGCMDIIVTENGEIKGKLSGWITDTLANNFLNLKE
jgi:hypothetical protein